MAALGDAGYREVTLLGQNVDAYGRDLEGFAQDGSGRRAWTFTDLLYHVHDVPGIQRIRFATSHPRWGLLMLLQVRAAKAFDGKACGAEACDQEDIALFKYRCIEVHWQALQAQANETSPLAAESAVTHEATAELRTPLLSH